MQCPGSLALCRDIPDSGSEFAAEGTAAHELAEDCLRKGTNAKEFLGRLFQIVSDDGLETYEFVVDDDMAAYVQTYIDFVRRESLGADLLIEQKLSTLPVYGVEDQSGTADAVVLDHLTGTVTVIDLKYGRGLKVHAASNDQLRTYGLAALEEHDLAGDWEQVRMVIHQPRLDHISEEVLTVDELRAWGIEAAEAAQVAMLAHKADVDECEANGWLRPSEKACQWCPAKAVCPALERFVGETCFDDLTLETVNDPTEDTAEDLGAKRALVSLVESWCKAVVAETDKRLELGQPVSGWKLVQGRRGARQWEDEAAAEDMLKKWRLKKDVMYTMKVVSPTQAEKILTPQRWEKAQELVVQKDGKPQAVPDSDPRPALEPTTFDDLTEN
jgi:hypothetical protein